MHTILHSQCLINSLHQQPQYETAETTKIVQAHLSGMHNFAIILVQTQ